MAVNMFGSGSDLDPDPLAHAQYVDDRLKPGRYFMSELTKLTGYTRITLERHLQRLDVPFTETKKASGHIAKQYNLESWFYRDRLLRAIDASIAEKHKATDIEEDEEEEALALDADIHKLMYDLFKDIRETERLKAHAEGKLEGAERIIEAKDQVIEAKDTALDALRYALQERPKQMPVIEYAPTLRTRVKRLLARFLG